MLKTDKPRDVLDLEFAVAQLRHLYVQLTHSAGMNTLAARNLADGLLAPQIKTLERHLQDRDVQPSPAN